MRGNETFKVAVRSLAEVSNEVLTSNGLKHEDVDWFIPHQANRRIIDAGKSVQIIGARRDDIVPVLDAIGGKGVYILTGFSSIEDAEDIETSVEPYR